jgi:TMEM175 potassium channel family protein
MEKHSSTQRLEAFSDGVFAIAITLLILEIHVPHGEEVAAAGGLWRALGHEWPSFVGFAISFATIGIMWINHHAMFEYIRRADRRLMLINVLFLLAISFVPFPTAVLADNLLDPAARVAATAFYSAAFVLCAVCFNLVWWAGTSDRSLLAADLHEAGLRTITSRYRMGPPTYLATVALAFVSPWLCLIAHGLLALLYALSERKA